jgi:hypothetical protein
MHAVAAAGAAFLVAVLWFDLMFDVQVRAHGGGPLPETVLASIRDYYRRVTTEARPMNRLITAVMLVTLATLVAEVALGHDPWWLTWGSLGAALGGIGLAAARTVRNAVQLGRAEGTGEEQSRLASSIYRDHLGCLVAMVLVVGLQLAARA